MYFNFKIILLLFLPYIIKGTYGYHQATSFLSDSLEIQSFTFHYNKIFGGKPAKKSQFPYQLSLRKYGRHICGASLIKVDEVLLAVTAAHCVTNGISNPAVYSVVAGDLKFSDTTGSEQTRRVAKIVVHENYDDNSRDISNDIALLFFKGHPFQLNDDVKNINLPKENEETFGNVTISGWGRTQNGGGLPDILQYIQMPVVNQTVCQAKWGNIIEISDGILCSGDDSGKMSPCSGDSGGPAKITNGALVGIVSFGPSSCAHQDYPAGFTKVSYYVKWIYSQVNRFTESA